MDPENSACLMCNCTEDDYGGLKTTNGTRAHYYCLLLSATIAQSGSDDQGILGFLQKDILREYQRSKIQRCYCCGQSGASLTCAFKKCYRNFHFPCGKDRNAHFNFKDYTAYCHLHRKKFNIPSRLKKTINNYHCVICLDKLTANDHTEIIWATCCRAVVLHRTCMQKFALSAGYFTKCPGCNDETKFLNVIKYHGVFVPERDASWELGNSYADLYKQHDTCDVVICKNPKGRTNFTTRGRWKLHLCSCCGSYGSHQHCSLVKSEFACPDCTLRKAEHISSLLNDPPIELDSNYDSKKTALPQKMISHHSSGFELGESSKTTSNNNCYNESPDLLEGSVFGGIFKEIDVNTILSKNVRDEDNLKKEISESILVEEMNETDVEGVCLQKVVAYPQCHKVFKTPLVLYSENTAIQLIKCDIRAVAEKWSRLNGIIKKLQQRCMECYNPFLFKQE